MSYANEGPRRGPAPARALGYAGLIPFIGLALIHFLAPEVDFPARLFVLYSAIILSFLGGIRWGVYSSQVRANHKDVWISIAVSLWAWGSLFYPALSIQIVLLLAGHVTAGFIDWLSPPVGQRSWLRGLRVQLSAVAIVCHLVVLL